MQNLVDRRWRRFHLCSLLILSLLGPTICGAASTVIAFDEQVLRDRVQSFWRSIQLFDLATAYGLEAGSSQGQLTASKFRRRWGSTNWELRSYEIESVSIEGVNAAVDLNLIWNIPQVPQPMTRSYTDRWILRDGDWYRDSGDYEQRASMGTT